MQLENQSSPILQTKTQIEKEPSFTSVEQIAKQYIQNFPKHLAKGEGMVWLGNQTTAKNVLMLQFFHALLETKYRIVKETNLSFLNHLIGAENQSLWDVYPEVEIAELLVIDDIGQPITMLSDAAKEAFNRILLIREDLNLPILFLTRCDSKSLSTLVGCKIASDLMNSKNLILNFDWKNSYFLQEKN